MGSKDNLVQPTLLNKRKNKTLMNMVISMLKEEEYQIYFGLKL